MFIFIQIYGKFSRLANVWAVILGYKRGIFLISFLGCPVICSDFIKKPEKLEILQFACELILFIQKEELRSEYREFDRMAFSSLATPSSSRFSKFLMKKMEQQTGHPISFYNFVVNEMFHYEQTKCFVTSKPLVMFPRNLSLCSPES